jgi:glycosyltransferase involved in cell wall biosynthesis
MEIHQVLVVASSGDAVTKAALDLQTQLRRLGASEIFAGRVDPSLADCVRPLEVYDRYVDRTRADLLVHHVSLGAESVLPFLRERSEPVALVYHDMTLGNQVAPDDPSFATLLESGREQLTGLADRVALAIADSERGAGELRALGYRQVVVSPPTVDAEALQGVVPDPDMEAYLARLDGPKFLFVGELLPQNRPDWLLAAYHALVTYLEPRAHLLLVGSDRLERYRSALDSYVAELHLEHSHITGEVSVESLVACYRAADVFVTASEHEGFCSPLLEAMVFEVPVLARAFGVIPETLGGAGLLLDRGDGPLVATEAMALLATDESVRADLVARGRRRLGELGHDETRSMLVGHLESVVS